MTTFILSRFSCLYLEDRGPIALIRATLPDVEALMLSSVGDVHCAHPAECDAAAELGALQARRAAQADQLHEGIGKTFEADEA